MRGCFKLQLMLCSNPLKDFLIACTMFTKIYFETCFNCVGKYFGDKADPLYKSLPNKVFGFN